MMPETFDEYYSRFGFSQLEVDPNLTYVCEAMPRLTERFNNRYAERMINKETLEQWQLSLQNKMDEIAPRYDRAYAIYAQKKLAMMEDVENGTHTISSGKSKNKSIDTPDATINENSNYADNLNIGEASSDVKTVMTGDGLVRSINDAIDDWRELDTEFVAEFENNFLNIFWY